MGENIERHVINAWSWKKAKSFALLFSEVAVQHNDVLSFDCVRRISSMEGGYIYVEILAFIVGVLNQPILNIFPTKSFALCTDQDC